MSLFRGVVTENFDIYCEIFACDVLVYLFIIYLLWKLNRQKYVFIRSTKWLFFFFSMNHFQPLQLLTQKNIIRFPLLYIKISQLQRVRPLSTNDNSHYALSIKTIKNILENSTIDEKVEVHGWIRSVRIQKNVSFAMVNDGSSLKGLQAILTAEAAKKFRETSIFFFF